MSYQMYETMIILVKLVNLQNHTLNKLFTSGQMFQPTFLKRNKYSPSVL